MERRPEVSFYVRPYHLASSGNGGYRVELHSSRTHDHPQNDEHHDRVTLVSRYEVP